MIRWHSSSRHRASSAVSTELLGSWPVRLALLVIALGLVLMHHVVGAHQHSAADAGPSGASAVSSVDQKAPPASGHHHLGGGVAQAGGADQREVAPETPDGTVATGSAALLHHHPDENGHDHAGSLLHLCLVALVGAAVFLVVLVLVALWRRPPPVRVGTKSAASATAPRAPPASSRLAELQVLRL